MALRDEKGRYVKGHDDLSAEEKIKKAASLRKSWKERKDYIGDIKNENPRIYNSWRAIMFTDKGKSVGCSDDWKDFRTFYNDVAPSYVKGKLLRRRDTQKQWSKDNFIWVTQEEASDLITGKVLLEYNGETLTLKQWSEKTNEPLNAIRIRYFRHKEDYSVKEIIYGKRINRFSKVPKDVSEVDSERAKASRMLSSYRHSDKKKGVSICDMDIDFMLENIIKKPCVYCGDTRRVGADRIDNTKGHTKDNVVPCCIECNSVRGDKFSYEEMLILGQTIKMIKEQRKVK